MCPPLYPPLSQNQIGTCGLNCHPSNTWLFSAIYIVLLKTLKFFITLMIIYVNKKNLLQQIQPIGNLHLKDKEIYEK